jgi:tetratricopeptide (TPR) repeat protein
MIFLSQRVPNKLARRPAFRRLLKDRAQDRGRTSARLRRYYFALIFLLSFCAVFPLGAQNDLPSRATELMRAGKFHDAELLWRQLEQQYPKDAGIHGNLGVALAQQGKLEPAAAEYHKSLAIKPDQPDVSYNLGVAEFKQGHFSDAIPAFEIVAKEKPEDHRSTVLLGMSYFGLRDYAKASQYLQKASQDDPSNLELHNVLAQSCLWSRQYECALTEYKSILAVNPDAVQAHMLMAQALDAMGKTEEAIKELEAARISPNEPVLHFELGYLYYKQRDYDRATPELQLEVKNNPGYAQSYLYLGDIALHTNDNRAAELLLQKALQLQNESRLAYFDLGCVYADQKKNQEAVAALEHAVKLDPSQPDAHYRLARLYTTLGQKEKAAQEFTKTKELHNKTEDSLIDKVSGDGAPPK